MKALTELPAGAEAPILRELHRSDLVAAVAVSGDLPPTRLEDYARSLEDRLRALPGVADVVIRGLSQRQWQVEVSRDVLARHGLSARDLAQVLARQSVDLPLGTLESRDRDILLRFTDQRRSLAELAGVVVVAGAGGGELTLGEIARLAEVKERPEEQVWFNGEPALVLEVSKTLRDDAPGVMAAIEGLVAAERERMQGTVRLTLTQDMTSIVRDRLRMLVSNGVMGLGLVLLVMALFFRPRLALWAVLGLPVAFMGTFAVMALLGLTLNMITLVALLMAIGIVMDDSIVITENIVVRAHDPDARDASPLAVVVEGTRQVAPGVLSSFLTTAAVFAPLAFLAGELGSVLEVLPVVLIAALAASLIEAFLILPHHLKGSVLDLRSGQESRLRAAFDHGFDAVRERVGRAADAAIRWRHGVLGLSPAVLLGSVGFLAGGHIGAEAMPDIDGDVLEARILMPQGTPLARTEAVAREVEAAMRRLDARFTAGLTADLTADLNLGQSAGAALVEATQVRFNHNPSARESGAHVATVIVDLLTAERRGISLDALAAAWRDEVGLIPGLVSLNIQEPGFGPAGIPIEVRLAGDDLDALHAAAQELAGHLSGYAGVYNVIDDLRPGKPERPGSPSPRVPMVSGSPPPRWPPRCGPPCSARSPTPSASARGTSRSWSAKRKRIATASTTWPIRPSSSRTGGASRWTWWRGWRRRATGCASPASTGGAPSPSRPMSIRARPTPRQSSASCAATGCRGSSNATRGSRSASKARWPARLRPAARSAAAS